jgi:hypothetical protein
MRKRRDKLKRKQNIKQRNQLYTEGYYKGLMTDKMNVKTLYQETYGKKR